ncbi:MAG: hypothetical protein L3J82_10505 [Planctomycetes bacterium]|nr:hypothetical protein [Planctomycetota bacterium]
MGDTNDTPDNPCSNQLAPEITGAMAVNIPQLLDAPVPVFITTFPQSPSVRATPAIQRQRNLNALPPPISIIVVNIQFIRV